ncbi:MAG: hypothetical protein QOE63_381 [Acidimicrobiaceae bacterium]
MAPMTDRKNPLEQALDLFFFAPLGLLMNAEEVVPQLIERGRQQVNMARVFGQMAVQQGGTEAGKANGKLQEQATDVVGQMSSGARRARPARPTTGGHATATAPAPAPAAAAPAPRPAAADAPAVGSLAIPDYDSLSASQVVPRLEGLAAPELDSVRQYELAHRGRKTILNKIVQLQG